MSDLVPERVDGEKLINPTDDTVEASKARQQIVRAAGAVVIAFIIANVIGMGQQLVMARLFGASTELDSYNAANRLTELLFNLVAGGALGSAFIPMFTALLTRKDRVGAWKLASGVINVVFLALLLVSGLVYTFAPWVVQHILFALAPGSSIGQLDLTVRLLRIMLPTVLIFGVSGLIMGILNAYQHFLIPAIAPAFYSLGIILGGVFWYKTMGVESLAYGTLIGSAAHLLIQLPSLLGLKERRYTFREGLSNPAVRKVVTLMLPRLVGAGVTQFNFVVNTIIALGLVEGSASALALAFVVFMMPQRTIAQSAGIAALPTLSAQAELKQYDTMRSTLAGIFRGILLLAIPSTFGLILIRYPLVRVFYEHGEFNSHMTDMMTWGLLWYTLGLVGHSLLEVLSRAFYALHDTRTPVTISVISVALNIALSLAFSQLFQTWGWFGLGGLALANSLATTLESVALYFILRKRLEGMQDSRIFDAAWRSGLASLVMSVVLWRVLQLLQGRSMLSLILGVIAGVLVYAVMLWILQVPEFAGMVTKLKSRLQKRK